MDYPFAALEAEYVKLLSVMRVTRIKEINSAAHRVYAKRGRYNEVSAKTGVPIAWLLAIDEREGGGDPLSYLGNGEHVIGTGRKTTLVPKGRGPFLTWQDGAIDAILFEKLDEVPSWTMPRACFEAEGWNGFGPRMHHRYSGYLWAGTDIYLGGKYVADGKWDPSTIDQQLGVVPMMRKLSEIDASMFIPEFIPVMPQSVPPGMKQALWIQESLNHLGQDPPLLEDGSFGRKTRTAVRAFQRAHGLTEDGLVGPITRAAIEILIKPTVISKNDSPRMQFANDVIKDAKNVQ